ncbi:DNA-processing protein DprA [Nocardia arizonensis]|uniref:DNA-processing protein DprA n=1 Tax=Nocardia arizonensis TaxID=1141647 RepID=UPI000A66F9A3|nr:DNA-processing protein DprA [Nocardia arizonensis]
MSLEGARNAPMVLPSHPTSSKLSVMGDVDANEHVALLALLDERPGKMTWSAIASEVALRGSAIALWDEIHPAALDGMSDDRDRLARACENLDAWRNSDFDLVTVLDPEYPVSLREIHQLPPILFVKGKLHPEEIGVSVVGSRAATDRGISVATHVARGLADRGISVLSGLAAGIDTAAHTAAIEAGGRPVGVIGTGINKTYPAANRDLHAQVAAHGALISQFLPDAPPQQHNFPIRNATMSGLGRASVVIEAGERSGARIQARLAIDHGRPVVLTDLVVRTTSWGKALVGRPGVHVAGSTAEVMNIVERVVATDLGRSNVPTLIPSPAGNENLG